MIGGPTFEEMLHPMALDPAVRERAVAARTADPLDPINLYNISWRDLATGGSTSSCCPRS